MASVLDSLAKMGLQLPPFLQQRQHAGGASAFNGSGPAFAAASAPGSSGPPEAGAGPFPPGMVDSFLVTAGHASPLMQLVLFVYRQLGAQLGLDPSLVLTVLGLLWGVSKLGSQVWAHAVGFVDHYFMCAMYVSEYDHIYVQLMKWLSQQQSIRGSRYLMAQTVWKSAWEEEDELENSLYWTDGDDGDGERKYLNFSNQAARSGPRYVPAMGVTAFWHGGTYFCVYRRRESLMNTSGWGPMKDQEEIKISCFGRSIEPIKRLLADAKWMYYEDTYRKTTIYRPKQKEMRRDNSLWQQVARRPVRPMRTVVLDSLEKHGVLADVNEYLHPATPRWYASRGIPLRRGYLFHGPPGTGKTSFSFALAGVFGIDIYVISLQDVNVTEEDLAALFTRLPRRCIVLLEDIDTAGLRRDADADADAKEVKKAAEETAKALTNGVNGDHDEKAGKTDKKEATNKKSNKEEEKEEDVESEDDDGSSSSESDEDAKAKSKAKAKAKAKGKRSGRAGKKATLDSISLSGLLNAIDGVASHEGRVLIMTTNKPESLDEALIRPGRVDVQVAFANASSTQASELFYRMYEASAVTATATARVRHRKAVAAAAASEADAQAKEDGGGGGSSKLAAPGGEEQPDVSEAEMRGIAEEFGRRIPGGLFSPAEIQGFLLKRKKCPRKALEDVAGWVEALVKQKETNSKVLTVQ
ncbi:mitochondrial chaperone BCS1-B [Tolypocladium capitatum]|uniref:Mitochondrial chaperone BCS1-B n=1 Tax=Tolypocladium capitatum TaxID=45235 RepID=A0A2K3QF34_9HYPO|nr:mitochondrial chaperone BCS1-B [Tolypocladium capitatum]